MPWFNSIAEVALLWALLWHHGVYELDRDNVGLGLIYLIASATFGFIGIYWMAKRNGLPF